MRHRSLLVAALATALLGAAGCGAPDKLDADDDRALATAREGLDDALDAEEAIRTSPALGRRLAARVERAGDDSKALERLVPSLVDDGEVDSQAVSAFVKHAGSDAPRALLAPAQRSVDRMVEVIDDSGADADTKVPHEGDRPLRAYLNQVQGDIGDVWPALTKELEEAI